MRQLSEEERKIIVKFYLQTGSLVLTQRKFRAHFPTIREKPPANTIKRLTEHFLAHGTVGNQNTGNSGRKITARTPLKIGQVIRRVEEKPEGSVRHLAQQVGLSRCSTHRILRKDLKLKAYKLSISQELSKSDCLQRLEFCRWFLGKCSSCPSFIGNISWSDEAHFYLHGLPNRQNHRHWGKNPPEKTLEIPLHSPKVTVWCALSAQGIIGPIFFEDGDGETVTVTSEFRPLSGSAGALLAVSQQQVRRHHVPAMVPAGRRSSAHVKSHAGLADRAPGKPADLQAGPPQLATPLTRPHPHGFLSMGVSEGRRVREGAAHARRAQEGHQRSHTRDNPGDMRPCSSGDHEARHHVR